MNPAKLSSELKAEIMEVQKIGLQIKLSLKKISGQKLSGVISGAAAGDDKEEIKN